MQCIMVRVFTQTSMLAIKTEPGFACAHRQTKEYVDEYCNGKAKDFKTLHADWNASRQGKIGRSIIYILLPTLVSYYPYIRQGL